MGGKSLRDTRRLAWIVNRVKAQEKELRRGAGTQILGGGNDEKADFEECVVGDGGCGVYLG